MNVYGSFSNPKPTFKRHYQSYTCVDRFDILDRHNKSRFGLMKIVKMVDDEKEVRYINPTYFMSFNSEVGMNIRIKVLTKDAPVSKKFDHDQHG